jgi:hypothetical protein
MKKISSTIQMNKKEIELIQNEMSDINEETSEENIEIIT